MRKLPENLQAPSIIHHTLPGVIEQQRVYKVITPLFGGGAVQQQWDEVTTIRGTEIRGQLRFWWRATQSGRFADAVALKMQEDIIWGKANKKKERGPAYEETVQIEISVPQAPTQVEPFFLKERDGKDPIPVSNPQSNIHPYAAFPLQLSRDEIKQHPRPPLKTVGKEGIAFTLTITFPFAYKQDVEAALWAWETFGGVGARTRRGFGALRLQSIKDQSLTTENLPLAPEKAQEWLEERLGKISGQSRGWPYLSKDTHFRVIYQNAANPMVIWKFLIEKLADFRQGKDGRFTRTSSRNGKTRIDYGRSYWPEAETVRALTEYRRSDLSELNHPKKFPRAVFGLPIIFHFIRDDHHSGPEVKKERDPDDTTLQADIKGSDRFASPLILKPLLCLNNQACGIALILDGSQIPPLILKEKRGAIHPVKHQLTEKDVEDLSQLKLNKNVDMLEAFLDYVGEGRKGENNR